MAIDPTKLESVTSTAAATGAAATPAPSPTISPEEFERIKNKAAYYEQTYNELAETLRPQAERIQRLIDDPEYATYLDGSYGQYQKLRETAKPELGPEWDPKNNPIIADVKETAAYAKELRKREADEADRKKQSWLNDAQQYAGRLQAENPKLATALNEDRELTQLLMNQAFNRGESFEDGIKRYVTRYGINIATEPKTPPTSLRPDAATANVVEETAKEREHRTTRTRTPMSPTERRARIADIIGREQKKAV